MKECKVHIPEGYEIDKENSTFECIKFKKIGLTIKEVLDSQKNPLNTLHIRVMKLSNYHLTYIPASQAIAEGFDAVIKSSTFLAKHVAYATLMAIAAYYNKEWKPDWENFKEKKYYIVLSKHGDVYMVEHREEYVPGGIPFKSINDARAVISNPNFREVLDVLYKS